MENRTQALSSRGVAATDRNMKYAPGKNPNSHKIIRKGRFNGQWKGKNASYSAVHTWVTCRLGRPRICNHCGTTNAKRYEWANVSKRYMRYFKDWIRLCVSCHIRYDRAKVCMNGHERTVENTYMAPRGSRSCKVCRRNGDMRRYYERKRMGRKERNFYVVRLEN